jgi:ketopantoate reductase
MKIAVVRPGSLDRCFGSRLAKAGTEVHFLARRAHLAARRNVGLSYESLKRRAAPALDHATDVSAY